MEEPSRRKKKRLPVSLKKNQEEKSSEKIVSWLPTTQEQRDQFIQITISGAWIGIGLLLLCWAIVRIVGPSLGWWVPADF